METAIKDLKLFSQYKLVSYSKSKQLGTKQGVKVVKII